MVILLRAEPPGGAGNSRHDHRPRHVRMYRAEVLIRSSLLEDEREFLVRVQCLGTEFLVGAGDRMRYVITIRPGDSSASGNRQRRGAEREIIDAHFFLSAPAALLLLILLLFRSTSHRNKRLVDDRKRVVPLHVIHAGD